MATRDRSVSGSDSVNILLQLVEKVHELRVGQILVVATKTLEIFNKENEELSIKLKKLLWGEETSKSGS